MIDKKIVVFFVFCSLSQKRISLNLVFFVAAVGVDVAAAAAVVVVVVAAVVAAVGVGGKENQKKKSVRKSDRL